MLTVRARNVNDAYARTMQLVKQYEAYRRPSRVGDVIKLPEPLAIRYERPRERVLFDVQRDANPFFHFMEAMWMLLGRNDVSWISQYTKQLAQFSDDGKTFHGAYGYRWRNHFDVDQLDMLINHLQNDPGSRRAILQMWDVQEDLGTISKDIPCNLMAKFEIEDGLLNMTVFNRSNDLILGALGANVVHFSFLQEFIADALDCGMGWYEQISANAHVYVSEWDKRGFLREKFISAPLPDPYEQGIVYPLGRDMLHDCNAETFLRDLALFAHDPFTEVECDYVTNVVQPLALAYEEYRRRNFILAYEELHECHALDWKLNCQQWLARRESAAKERASYA
jgi:hypothetical protein